MLSTRSELLADSVPAPLPLLPSLSPLSLLLRSDWPTLPQLFVHGEFVGGSDIVGNMYKSGELDKLLGTSPGASN